MPLGTEINKAYNLKKKWEGQGKHGGLQTKEEKNNPHSDGETCHEEEEEHLQTAG